MWDGQTTNQVRVFGGDWAHASGINTERAVLCRTFSLVLPPSLFYSQLLLRAQPFFSDISMAVHKLSDYSPVAPEPPGPAIDMQNMSTVVQHQHQHQHQHHQQQAAAMPSGSSPVVIVVGQSGASVKQSDDCCFGCCMGCLFSVPGICCAAFANDSESFVKGWIISTLWPCIVLAFVVLLIFLGVITLADLSH
jgi:hypothetical protein